MLLNKTGGNKQTNKADNIANAEKLSEKKRKGKRIV